MHRYHNIANVVRDSLCTGCGICYSICPSHAIVMKRTADGIFAPEIDNAKCNDCGLCGDVCPGHSVDFDNLNIGCFGKCPDDALLGNFLNCYIGYATDEKIRMESSSGGLITALLVFALENDLIDGAIVVRMQQNSPLMPEVIIARTKAEILSSRGSKYCPVPINIGLREAMRDGGRYAMVGLPCHMHGIRKAEVRDKEVRARIVLHVGIFCSHSVSFSGTEDLLRGEGIDANKVSNLSYRGNGWPGGMTINLEDGHSRFIPLVLSWGKYLNRDCYIPNRCFFCLDALAELSDISFGDAWLSEYKSDTLGSSIVISRTELGEKLLHKASTDRIIEVKQATLTQIFDSQRRILHSKKKNLKARFAAARLLRKRTPHYNYEGMRKLKPGLLAYLLCLVPFCEKRLASSKALSFLVKRIPSVIIERCRGLRSYLSEVEFSRAVKSLRRLL